MKKIKAVKFTISMFSILNLSALFGQSTPSAIKFLNCEWGILPAEAIAALEQGSVDIDIKEDKNLEYENRAKGIREFVTRSFLFADYKWELKLIFIDNKLASVFLTSSNANKLKAIEELEATFGERETTLIGATPLMEEWKAKDGSHVELINPKLPSEQIIIGFWGPGCYEEFQKRKKEIY